MLLLSEMKVQTETKNCKGTWKYESLFFGVKSAIRNHRINYSVFLYTRKIADNRGE